MADSKLKRCAYFAYFLHSYSKHEKRVFKSFSLPIITELIVKPSDEKETKNVLNDWRLVVLSLHPEPTDKKLSLFLGINEVVKRLQAVRTNDLWPE